MNLNTCVVEDLTPEPLDDHNLYATICMDCLQSDVQDSSRNIAACKGSHHSQDGGLVHTLGSSVDIFDLQQHRLNVFILHRSFRS